jgi:signal peptidase II
MNAEPGARIVPANRYLMFFGVAVGGCAIDLASKSWIFDRLGMPGRNQIWLWRPIFSLTTSLNEGALFGLGQGLTAVFAALLVAAAIFIIYWLFCAGAARDWVLTLTLALIAAGIFGNLYDRLGMHGLRWPGTAERVYAVRDWLYFRIDGVINWPVFNLADSLLVCGAVVLFWHVWTMQRSSESGAKPTGNPSETASAAAANE